MAAITWNDVTAMAAELGSVAADAQTAILAYVNDADTFKVADWGGEDGTSTKLGRLYLAAHFGMISLQSGWEGLKPPATSEDYKSTAYGRTFVSLARRACAGGVVI